MVGVTEPAYAKPWSGKLSHRVGALAAPTFVTHAWQKAVQLADSHLRYTCMAEGRAIGRRPMLATTRGLHVAKPTYYLVD